MTEESEHLDLSVTVGGAVFTGAGPADRVMQALERFSELVEAHGSVAPPAQDSVEQPSISDLAETDIDDPPQDSAASRMPLPQFLARETIKKKNPEIATAIVIWAADHDGKTSVTNAEIETYWKGTPLKVPGNLARDVNVAVRNGWLVRDGRNLTATGFGREAVGLSA